MIIVNTPIFQSKTDWQNYLKQMISYDKPDNERFAIITFKENGRTKIRPVWFSGNREHGFMACSAHVCMEKVTDFENTESNKISCMHVLVGDQLWTFDMIGNDEIPPEDTLPNGVISIRLITAAEYVAYKLQQHIDLASCSELHCDKRKKWDTGWTKG